MNRKRPLINYLLTISSLLVAIPCWGVFGDLEINVRDSDGRTVPRAVISLTAPGRDPVTQETDATGITTFALEEGDYSVEIIHAGSVTTATVTIRPGEFSRVRISIPGALPTPPFTGSHASGIYLYEDADDARRTASMEKLTTTLRTDFGGVIEFSDETTADAALLDQRNAELDTPIRLHTAGAEVNFTFGAGGSPANAFGLLAWQAGQVSPQDIEASSRVTAKRVYPSVSGMIGRADVEFQFVDLLGSAPTVTHKGNGTLWGLRGNVMLLLCDDCKWFAGATYSYRETGTIRSTRSPALSGAGLRFISDAGEFNYRYQSAEGIAGLLWKRLALFGGVRGAFRRITLNGDIRFEILEVPVGFQSGELKIAFTEEFEENSVEGVTGFDFRSGRFVAGVEGSFDNSTLTLSAGAGFTF